MTEKQKQLAFVLLGGVALTQFGAAMMLAGKHAELQKKYAELYELAAYLAGKAEGAGVELDEEDRLAMQVMKPD